MGIKKTRPRKSRRRTVERLEERCVMSAEPLAPLSGNLNEGVPDLVHHAQRDADFWIDPVADYDLDALMGDMEKALSSAHGLTGLSGVRNNYGFIGTGQTVAVIDSGIAYYHYALGGGYGANYRVVGGWDFTENDSNPHDDGPEGSHGTHVAGIVGADASGTSNDGVAPGVDLVGLRVFNDAGEGYFSWVESALQWVHTYRNSFENPITAVNLSLGTSWNSNSVPSWSTLEDEFAQLEADGIFITVSAGNSFTLTSPPPSGYYNTPGLSYPAASPYVVPVMSVDDTGSLSHFSQRHTRAIAAPGRFIVSTVPDYAGNNNGVVDDFASFSGTSMAAPYVAGASVLLREAMQFVGYATINQDVIFDHMMSTAETFFDAATSQSYKRLNLTNAFNELMPADEYGSTASAAHNLGTLSGQSTVNGLIGTLTDADYFRFTAASSGTVSFTISTTHELTPVWSGAGSVSGNGQTYTFQVVAGQSYSFGLSTGDGIGWYTMTVNAGASMPNSAPVLQPIGNRSVSQGSTLNFTVSANDPDAGQQLRYGLNNGPSGATLHPTTGAFSWTPNSSHAPGTYTMTIWVIDDQTPFKYDNETFEITVTAPPPSSSVIRYLSTASNSWLQSSDGSWLLVSNGDVVQLESDSSSFKYSMHLNGADVGLNVGENIDGFTFLSDGSILVSTSGAFSVNSTYSAPGVGSGPVITGGGEDILRFIPTTVGNNTTGTWSLYFDGSDVGLSGSSENIDTITVLSNGRLVISTSGNAIVPGGSAADEDLIVFTPSSLGQNTWGTWDIYFDGSDVGLSTTDENIDAAFVAEWSATPQILLSTRGFYSVPGNSGANEDIFAFRPTQLGGSTIGQFMPYLILDGSAFGLGAIDVDGFYYGRAPGGMSGNAMSQSNDVALAKVHEELGESLSRSLEPRRTILGKTAVAASAHIGKSIASNPTVADSWDEVLLACCDADGESVERGDDNDRQQLYSKLLRDERSSAPAPEMLIDEIFQELGRAI